MRRRGGEGRLEGTNIVEWREEGDGWIQPREMIINEAILLVAVEAAAKRKEGVELVCRGATK